MQTSMGTITMRVAADNSPLAVANFVALAPDGLTSVGGFPGNDEEGAKKFQQVDRAKMTEDFVASANWLRTHAESTGRLTDQPLREAGAWGVLRPGTSVNGLSPLFPRVEQA